MLVYIEAPHFFAGIVFEKGHVVRTAPIVSYMLGWSKFGVKNYCAHKRWKCGKCPTTAS